AYFGETRWRSAGSVGHGRLFLDENDTGPDDAVHSFDGIIAYFDPQHPQKRDLGVQAILDVAPTLYRLMHAPAASRTSSTAFSTSVRRNSSTYPPTSTSRRSVGGSLSFCPATGSGNASGSTMTSRSRSPRAGRCSSMRSCTTA